MQINKKTISANGLRFSIERDGKEVARGYLYFLYNEHGRPFGLMEDVYVGQTFRGQGLGTELVKEIIKTAEENDCYKLVGTSRHARPKVHKLYKRLGFGDWGKEFRIDFK